MNRQSLSILAALSLLLLAACTGNPSAPPEQTSPALPPETPEITSAATPMPTPAPTPAPTLAETDLSAFPDPVQLPISTSLPDIFTLRSGKEVESREDYEARLRELRELYQYYMYGYYPDAANEHLSYTREGTKLMLHVEKDGVSASFEAFLAVPNPEISPMPEGGYPVIIDLSVAWGPAFTPFIPYQYAVDNGYAVISINTAGVAADDTSRSGAFYDLYPYTGDPFTQAGTLIAWAWGGGKVIDALEQGLGGEAGLSAENIILTGVSRWGKAAAVAGAFEQRIKVTMPACSGAGGMALYRYSSQGKTYDYSAIGASSAYEMTANEHLGSLQSSGEAGWFNDMFLKFTYASELPVDQHMLAALCGSGGRYLFITGSYLYEDWTNPPAMYGAFLAAQEAFSFTGNAGHLAINLHKEGHAVLEEDLEKLFAYCNYHFYGIQPPFDLSALQTSLYDTVEANRYFDLDELVGRTSLEP